MRLLTGSLRLRLLTLILVPLVCVSIIAIYWRFEAARATAEDIFDRNLVMLCFAVSRDVRHSGGDSLSQTTANLFRSASGGNIFYHVIGPDGSFVTGYSTPPVAANFETLKYNTPSLFDAQHLGVKVRAASLAEQVEIDGIAGTSVVTVWQNFEPRHKFATRLAYQSILLTTLLVLTVAALVIFGIRFGLKPLEQLEAAIKKRSASDLSAIERQIPIEAQGIVSRLNHLFAQLTQANEARDRLISNAAHQLKNPISAIHAMAEAAVNAPNAQESKIRALELMDETRRASRLTKQMLSLERVNAAPAKLQNLDFNGFIKAEMTRHAPHILDQDIELNVVLPRDQLLMDFDPTLAGEVLSNLLDNALAHGGKKLTTIEVKLIDEPAAAKLIVCNNGHPIPITNLPQLFERFKQGYENNGSGLGLSIVADIAKTHGWRVSIEQTVDVCFIIELGIVRMNQLARENVGN